MMDFLNEENIPRLFEDFYYPLCVVARNTSEVLFYNQAYTKLVPPVTDYKPGIKYCHFFHGENPPMNYLEAMASMANKGEHLMESSQNGVFFGVIVRTSVWKEVPVYLVCLNSTNTRLLDPLTGTFTQTAFAQGVSAKLEDILANAGKPVYVFADIQGMKHINSTQGYYAGNRVIQEVADGLRKAFPRGLYARYESDHFLILEDESRIMEALEQLQRSQRLNVKLKFGLYLPEDPHEDYAVCSDKARLAQQHIVGNYTRSMFTFTSELYEEYRRRHYIRDNLTKAMEEGEIQVHYQSVIRSMTVNTCSLEALARWNSKEEGMISPGEFIPVLENERLSAKLDLYVIEKVLQDFDRRLELGLKVLPVSVNLSPVDLETEDMVSRINELMKRYQIDHDLLIIEITESACASSPELLEKVIADFHKSGYQVWMDDFGSGYSSLNTLQQFSFDLIKLDMRFLENFSVDGRGAVILRNLIRMAEELQIHTLAEGVETEEQFRFLKSIGCERLQGYYFCRPLPLEDFVQRKEEGKLITAENYKSGSYFDAITGINQSDDRMPKDLRNRMMRLPEALLEMQGNGDLSFVRSNFEYMKYLLDAGIVKPEQTDVSRRAEWKIKTPLVMAKAVQESLETESWVSFQDLSTKPLYQADVDLEKLGLEEDRRKSGVQCWVYAMAEDTERQAVCFRIIIVG